MLTTICTYVGAWVIYDKVVKPVVKAGAKAVSRKVYEIGKAQAEKEENERAEMEVLFKD